jgi:anti-anti-sigma factor
MGEFLPQSVIEDSLLSCQEEPGAEEGRGNARDGDRPITVASVGCQTVREWQGSMIRERLEAAMEHGGGRIALCLGGVTGISSAFIRDLIQLSDRCKMKGGRMILFGVDPAIGALFRAAGFDAKLELAACREDAVDLIRSGAAAGSQHHYGKRAGSGFLGRLMGKRAA